jgi:hypothetical protein
LTVAELEANLAEVSDDSIDVEFILREGTRENGLTLAETIEEDPIPTGDNVLRIVFTKTA